MSADWCLNCLEEFHLDDTGGYNPPCSCAECDGFYCRSCCVREREDYMPDAGQTPYESYLDDEGAV